RLLSKTLLCGAELISKRRPLRDAYHVTTTIEVTLTFGVMHHLDVVSVVNSAISLLRLNAQSGLNELPNRTLNLVTNGTFQGT
ncbi:hypothetical protein, partial [Paraglaciecola sp. 20A4]|uniref:hypothetical protein n=1 Tax=Paraglaciecola sp. 20A4 TaxID=2687288 RepID=UPI00197CF7A9